MGPSLANRACVELHGWIADFWEQGMEEPPWHIFQDEKWADSREGGWSREGMYTFRDGDRLTILEDDGSVLWAGQLRDRKSGWFSTLAASSCEWHPEEVPAETWSAWFRRSPALRAVYVTGDPSTSS